MPRVSKKAAAKAASKKAPAKKAASKAEAQTPATGSEDGTKTGRKGYRIKGENYVPAKTAAGGKSYHSGDAVARELEGQDLDAVYKQAAKETGVKESELREKYGHLNTGLQRMALGNRIRGARTKKEEAA